MARLGDVVTRLGAVSHELAAVFANEGSAFRQQALSVACARAAQDSELASAEIIEALRIIHDGGYDATLGGRLGQLSQLLDDQYFDLSERAEAEQVPPEALCHFRRARATSALALALGGEHGAGDALYEAISASASPDALIAALLQLSRSPEAP